MLVIFFGCLSVLFFGSDATWVPWSVSFPPWDAAWIYVFFSAGCSLASCGCRNLLSVLSLSVGLLCIFLFVGRQLFGRVFFVVRWIKVSKRFLE